MASWSWFFWLGCKLSICAVKLKKTLQMKATPPSIAQGSHKAHQVGPLSLIQSSTEFSKVLSLCFHGVVGSVASVSGNLFQLVFFTSVHRNIGIFFKKRNTYNKIVCLFLSVSGEWKTKHNTNINLVA